MRRDHRALPYQPDAKDSLGRPRRKAICIVCSETVFRVSALRNLRPIPGAPGQNRGERRVEWRHGARRSK